MKHTFNFFFFSLLFALLFSACNNKDSFKLTLTAPSGNYDGDTVLFYDYATQDSIIDSVVFKGGKLEYNFNATEPFVLCAIIGNEKSAVVVAEPGKAEYNLDDETLSGTPLNDSLMAFNERYKEYQNSILDYIDSADVSEASIYVFYVMLTNMYYELYEQHADNVLGCFAFSFFLNLHLQMLGTPINELEQYFDGVPQYILSYPPTQRIMSQVENQKLTAVGNSFVDFDGVDPFSNKPVKLSDVVKGHVAVVDFWASWCGPCCKEISETLVPLYNKYKNKGLVVVGVSLDQDADKSKEAVKNLGINYPQILDTKQSAATMYAIAAIPYIIVLDANGIIVQTGLRGEELEEAVKQLIK